MNEKIKLIKLIHPNVIRDQYLLRVDETSKKESSRILKFADRGPFNSITSYLLDHNFYIFLSGSIAKDYFLNQRVKDYRFVNLIASGAQENMNKTRKYLHNLEYLEDICGSSFKHNNRVYQELLGQIQDKKNELVVLRPDSFFFSKSDIIVRFRSLNGYTLEDIALPLTE